MTSWAIRTFLILIFFFINIFSSRTHHCNNKNQKKKLQKNVQVVVIIIFKIHYPRMHTKKVNRSIIILLIPSTSLHVGRLTNIQQVGLVHLFNVPLSFYAIISYFGVTVEKSPRMQKSVVFKYVVRETSQRHTCYSCTEVGRIPTAVVSRSVRLLHRRRHTRGRAIYHMAIRTS